MKKTLFDLDTNQWERWNEMFKAIVDVFGVEKYFIGIGSHPSPITITLDSLEHFVLLATRLYLKLSSYPREYPAGEETLNLNSPSYSKSQLQQFLFLQVPAKAIR